MWVFLVSIFGICILVTFVVYIAFNSKEVKTRDVFLDFKTAKRALIEFRKVNTTKCLDLNEVKQWLALDAEGILSNYELSEGERFLIYKGTVTREYAKELIKKIGGHSYYDEGTKRLHLALLQFKVSEFDPIAIINYFPKDNITTTTKIEWTYNESNTEGKEVLEVEWQNCKERYDEAGQQVVGLRVKDRNGNWSDWAETVIEVKEEKGVKGIASGGSHFFKFHLSGKVDIYGKNKYGQLGDGTFNDYDHTKRLLGFDNVAQIAAGDSHTLFKHYDGTASACGNNDYGQLGNGSRNTNKSPQKIWGLDQVKRLAASGDFSIALLTTGAVMTWGVNDHGQLGEEKLNYRELPKRVKDVSRVKQVDCSSSHVVAVHHDGTVTAWGDNSQGQLCTGFKGKQSEPVVSTIAGVFYVAAGKNFTIFVLDNGRVKCVGNNQHGQLGLASEATVMFAKEIPDLKNVVKAMAYDSFTVALTDIGEVYTWGRYSSKDGETYYKPTKVEGLKYVKDIACSSSKGYALMEDGRVVLWAGNLDASEYLNEVKST